MSPLSGVPPGPKMSKFHAVFRKFWQNHMLAPHSPEELPPILEIRDPSLPPPMIVHTNHAWKTMICMSSAPAKFLPSAMRLRRLCFYTCLSVDRGEVCLTACWNTTPLGADTPQHTATAADGTHPTGRYSYSRNPRGHR